MVGREPLHCFGQELQDRCAHFWFHLFAECRKLGLGISEEHQSVRPFAVLDAVSRRLLWLLGPVINFTNQRRWLARGSLD